MTFWCATAATTTHALSGPLSLIPPTRLARLSRAIYSCPLSLIPPTLARSHLNLTANPTRTYQTGTLTQGVPPEASQGQIKKAYYQRARECHPDKHAGDEAKAEEFKRLSDAYQTLFDNERRAAYDRHGKAGEQGGTWVDPRDLYAATFGGPEFEPWVGVLGAQPPDELVQAAERAVAAVVAKAEELSVLQREGDADASPAAPLPSAAVSTCAQELAEAQLAAKEAAAALDSAAKALQQQRVAACAGALLERIAPYVELCLEHSSGRADRTVERAAYRAEMEAVYEALRAQPMGKSPSCTRSHLDPDPDPDHCI